MFGDDCIFEIPGEYVSTHGVVSQELSDSLTDHH